MHTNKHTHTHRIPSSIWIQEKKTIKCCERNPKEIETNGVDVNDETSALLPSLIDKGIPIK